MVVSACSWDPFLFAHIGWQASPERSHVSVQVMLKTPATSFSRPTWDIVDHIHKDTTAYIDEHNRLWTRPSHDVDLVINEKMATVLQLPVSP